MSFTALALWLGGALSPTSIANESWRYRAEFQADTQLLRVQVCTPSATVPLVLRALDRPALEHLQIGSDWQLDERRWQIRHTGGACGGYDVELGRLAAKYQKLTGDLFGGGYSSEKAKAKAEDLAEKARETAETVTDKVEDMVTGGSSDEDAG